MNARLREQYGREQAERMNSGLPIIIWSDWLESRLADRIRQVETLDNFHKADTIDFNRYESERLQAIDKAVEICARPWLNLAPSMVEVTPEMLSFINDIMVMRSWEIWNVLQGKEKTTPIYPIPPPKLSKPEEPK